MPKKKNSEPEIELFIESTGFEGKAIARDNGVVYFVSKAIPGDRVRARIQKRKKSFIEATVMEILEPSPDRETPRCRYFGTCGGCKWQDLRYTEQTRWKTLHVRDAFERLAKISIGKLHDTIPCAEPWYYRNKMEYSFGDSRWLTPQEVQSGIIYDKNFALGLHVPGRFDKVLDIEECFLQSPLSSAIVNNIRSASQRFTPAVYQTRTHEGFLRNVVVRTSVATGEVMVILVSSAPATDNDTNFLEWFISTFPQTFPEVTTTIHAISASKALLAMGDARVLYGAGTITETLCDVRFRVSPFSFFQTNTRQAEVLFTTALEYAGLVKGVSSDKVIWDLYCGAGSITLPAALRAKRVVGIELSETSIMDARHNAAANNIHNVEFYAEDMHKAVQDGLMASLPRPDVVIVDPPRAGMHPSVVENIAAIAPPEIVYVSCNPTTQARDCALLAERYTVEEIQPVDMFPHTYHIESIARLRLKI